MKIEDLTQYEIIEKREISDLKSMSYLLKHKKTGARIALLENDDENKVFTIGFLMIGQSFANPQLVVFGASPLPPLLIRENSPKFN